MYKTKKIKEKIVYYSDMVPIEHFFTTRDFVLKENLDILAEYLNIPKENIIHPHQVHGDNIEFVDNKKEYPNCDALILNKKNYAIYLNFADCTPVILYDKKKNMASIAHAGWRGTALKIAPKTVKKMKSNPSDIIALIGPCISFDYFETYTEALLELKNSVENQEGLFRDNYADLKGINKRQLEEIGVKMFDVIPYCTVKDNDKFFSYRKENKTKLRHSALVML